MTIKRKPIIGEAFDSHQMNGAGRIACYVRELRYYRPRGFAALAKEGDKLADMLDSDDCRDDAADHVESWICDVETLLTEWARRSMRNEYVCFGPMSDAWGSIGFYYAVDSAIEDCDIRLDAGDSVPRGFSGLACFVSDHGNITIQSFSRGRMTRELLSVV